MGAVKLYKTLLIIMKRKAEKTPTGTDKASAASALIFSMVAITTAKVAAAAGSAEIFPPNIHRTHEDRLDRSSHNDSCLNIP